MKKTFRIVTLVLAAVLLLGILASCSLFGKTLSGSYKAENGASYSFDGKNFTFKQDTVMFKGTYEIKELDEDYFIFFNVKSATVGGEKFEVEPDYLSGEDGLEFRELNGYIKIDTIFYYEVE